jgi:hypothetical protein
VQWYTVYAATLPVTPVGTVKFTAISSPEMKHTCQVSLTRRPQLRLANPGPNAVLREWQERAPAQELSGKGQLPGLTWPMPLWISAPILVSRLAVASRSVLSVYFLQVFSSSIIF